MSITWVEGIAFGPGVYRDVVPGSRTIRRDGTSAAGPSDRAPATADRTTGPPGASPGVTQWVGGRRGRPRKDPRPTDELPAALVRFLEACERTAVEGVILRQTLRDTLNLTDSTLNQYASTLRCRGLFPFKIGGTPWHHDMHRGATAKKGGAA